MKSTKINLGVSGGDKLQELLKQIADKTSGGKAVRVGFLAGATYPTGSSAVNRAKYAKRVAAGNTAPMEGSGAVGVPTVAAANEYGDPAHNRPPRPFFRNMIFLKSPTWAASLSGVLKAANYDVDLTFQRMGLGIEGQLQESIRTFTTPALAESTIEHKGFDKPLIDTSHMLRSTGFEVTTLASAENAP